MVMRVDDRRGKDGFPIVRWEQEVPTGQSAYAVEQSVALKIAAVVMVFVFVAVYSGGGGFWVAVIAAMMLGGMMLGGDQMFKGGITVGDVHIKGPEPSPYKAEAEQRARATAMITTEYCEALVLPHGKTNELTFWVFRGPNVVNRVRRHGRILPRGGGAVSSAASRGPALAFLI